MVDRRSRRAAGSLGIVRLQRLPLEWRIGDRPVAEACLRELETTAEQGNPTFQAVLLSFKALRAQASGQSRTAADLAERGYAAAVQSRSLFHEIVFALIAADVLLDARFPERAAPLVARARALMERSEPLTNHAAVLALVEAWLAEQQGRQEDSLRFLASGLAIAGTGSGWVRLRFHGATMRHMFAVALEHGIEPALVRELIHRFRLRPEDVHVDAWPWAIRIRTLGVFEVLLDGVPLGFGRKAPRKSLALLKLLVALGPREVPEQQAVDAMWPDQEGDAAHSALKATVLRLRRLLRDNDAIRQSAGKLSLDRKRCWVDAWSFEHGLAQAAARDPNAVGRDLERAFAHYGGGLLPDDGDEPWAMAARERLRAKYIDAAVGLGGSLEAAGRHHEALNCYLKGLDADPLVETFYQGLMRCHLALDRRGEAADAYRRLKKMLAVSLGVKPAPATERLYQSLRTD